MAKPPGFDEWIKIANETGKTPEERQRLRNDVYRRYGMKPPSDRGGFAGIWDRNKQIIKPVVQFTAGYFGGPGAAAGAGALMEGADRPGKRGVGFDAGAGLRGGIQGYGVGKIASGLPGGAGATAAPAAAPAASQAASTTADVASAAEPYSSARSLLAGTGDQTDLVARAMQTGRALDINTPTPPPMFTLEDLQKSQYLTDAATINTAGTTPMNTANPSLLSSLLSGAGSMAGNVADYFKNMKPEVLQGILQGGGTALGGYLNRGAEEQRLEFMREQQRLEQERMNRLARLLMPMAEAQGQRVGAQYGGAGMMG